MNHDARLRLLDMLFEFVGYATRRNLMDHFDIATATASRDFKTYEKLRPGNVAYNVRSRRYERQRTFTPAYTHNLENVLIFLTSSRWIQPHPNPKMGYSLEYQFPHGMSPAIVAGITRAIAASAAISVEYASATSVGERVIVPHSLLTNGANWYVRCYDRKSKEFRTFRMSRFHSVGEDATIRRSHEGQDRDQEWLSCVTLTLSPHPNHENPEAFRRDLGLSDKPVVNITVPSAMAGFTLSALRVDCSPEGSMDHHQFPFRCMNMHELCGLESIQIAPGVTTTKHQN